jgi:hypothetical protein
VLGHLLPGRRWRLREISLESSVVGGLLLRIHSLFEGVVVGPNLVLVAVPRPIEVSSVEDLKQASKSTQYSQFKMKSHDT